MICTLNSYIKYAFEIWNYLSIYKFELCVHVRKQDVSKSRSENRYNVRTVMYNLLIGGSISA